MTLVGDGTADDTADAQALVSAAISANQTAAFPPGRFNLTSPVAFSYAGLADDPAVVRGRSDIVGGGATSSVFAPSVSGNFALTGSGDTAFGSHFHTNIGGFSFTGNPGAKGLRLFNAAYVNGTDMTFHGLATGLELESVLSSKFDHLSFKWCGVGANLLKGSGFSGINAVKFSSCEWGGNTALGVQGAAYSSTISFDGCIIEGNGAQGNSFAGGAVLTFTGNDGCVGVTFTGCYFENNAGAFDVHLVNTGANYVAHTFIGCNFNRVSSGRYVTNNVKTMGKNRIVFIGCSFRGFGTYAESSARKYVGGDGQEIIKCINCDFGSTAAQGTLVNI